MVQTAGVFVFLQYNYIISLYIFIKVYGSSGGGEIDSIQV